MTDGATGAELDGAAFRLARADDVRAHMAAAILDEGSGRARLARDADASSVVMLGDITLLPHQRDAVRRVHLAMARFGGALLADDVGLGKTYVALAVAREHEDAVVVAPAALRSTWRDAMRRAQVVRPIVSLESLGRRSRTRTRVTAGRRPSLVVVDEAHHARNRATRRYAALADLTADARVLLLSATPVHNRADDLRAILALFLGARAAHASDALLARCIVRRRATDLRGEAASTSGQRPVLASAPRVRPVQPLHIRADDATLARLLALPPPVPPADGGVATALVALGLVRQWASSVAAVRAALRRRLTRTVALHAGACEGRVPTTAELRRAVVADDVVQFEFPALLSTRATDAAATVAALDAHADALRSVLRALDRADVARDADDERAQCVRAVCAAHPGERIVAFTAYVETATALFRRLRADGGVCVLTARGGMVAGGRLTRTEALHRFAPHAHGRAPPPAAEAITLLLATDVLSEGIGLQDASVVVHLDLPWTPARLAQRVGRVARLGSPHHEIAVHAIMPPASAEAWLGAERRLRAKLGTAARLVGAIDPVLPVNAQVRREDDGGDGAPGTVIEAMRRVLRAWRGPACGLGAASDVLGAVSPADRRPWVATVQHVTAPRGAMLALVGDPPVLVARSGGDAPISEAPAIVLATMTSLAAATDATEAVGAPGAPGAAAVVSDALDALADWQHAQAAAAAVGLPTHGQARALLLRRVARMVTNAPRDRRVEIATLATAARRTLVGDASAGVERRLARLLEPAGLHPSSSAEQGDDAAFLRRIVAARDVHACTTIDDERDMRHTPLHALVVVVAR